MSDIVKSTVDNLLKDWDYDKVMRYLKMHDKGLGLQEHIKYLKSLKIKKDK